MAFDLPDSTGLITLQQLSAATSFNRWLFQTIEPFCRGRILEIGSGIGNLSRLFLEKQLQLTVSDVEPEYCRILSRELTKYSTLEDIKLLDIAATGIEEQFPDLMGQFDTIVAVNVIEHIENDRQAVSNCKKMLKPGARLVVLVPAYQLLYNRLDKELGHYRRYTTVSLQKLLESQGLQVLNQMQFNAAGLLGWVVSGSILQKKIIPEGPLHLYDKLVPFLKIIDRITMHRLGLSVIQVASA